ncbi:bactofilin family protein [Vreelandella titanicae]|uniref:Polymer-forming cytoskeletal protein n=1 Tax=Vreelandella titanicae TaxID=664683 RepID=A0A558J7X5_9GAMM|nr:polymer-forming cytoskeletal protein [Halomonas titanicae]TVU89723.1 polymer-forming cytoskeletal protein [Halomonas titanicae]
MGIQVWFIVLGVGVMTLIVWDGKRRKLKQRSLSAASIAHHAPAAASAPIPDKPFEAISPPAAETSTVAPPDLGHIRGGSRIGSATHVLGKVIADEPVLIKGRLEGTLIAPNHPVSVTATGHVTSYIEGNSIDIDGQIVGTLKANTKATLLARARIVGVVEAPRLECMAGAWLQVDVAQKTSRQRIAMVS